MFFRTTGGHNISIDRGNYGWATDVEKETELLIDDILNGRDISREPEYVHTAYVKGQNDVGPSYVEIDLSNQHLYLYINNKLDFEKMYPTSITNYRLITILPAKIMKEIVHESLLNYILVSNKFSFYQS